MPASSHHPDLMKIVLAATGASGAIYLQRLLARIDALNRDPSIHGILLQLPHKFFAKVAKENGFTLPDVINEAVIEAV